MSSDPAPRLSDLEVRFSNLAKDVRRGRQVSRYERGRDDAWKKELVEILEGVSGVVEDAQDAGGDLGDLLKKAESILNGTITLAYEGYDYQLFEGLDSFAHSERRPLAKLEPGENVHPRQIVNAFRQMMRIMGTRQPIDKTKLPRTPPPWKEVTPAHALSSRCARFAPRIPTPTPASDKLLALSVFQARSEVTSVKVPLPTSMFASQSGKAIFVPAEGGYRNRSPYLATFYPNEEPRKGLKGKTTKLGLDRVAHHGAADDDRGLLFVGDSYRVKSYAFWDNAQGTKRENLLPVHTFKSDGFESAIGVLPQGTVARAGRGAVAIWNLDDQPTHQNSRKGIVGRDLGPAEEEAFSSARDDYQNIEQSSGSKPTTVLRLPEQDFMISRWHNHPTASGTMLVGTNNQQNSQFYCRSLDLEQEGKWVTRYIGHGGEINEFSTSRGDPNLFVTACNDNHARLFDVRHPLPVLTIEAGVGNPNCSSAALCHPDGIPYIFATQEESEMITLWDVRARAAVYDLATGNNCVSGMVWNDERNELYAATYCQYLGTDGSHMDYAPARIPVDANARNRDPHDGGEVVDDDADSDYEDEEEDGYDDVPQAWPKRAYHEETYFGHIFDSGDSRIFRYAFKTEPNLNIVPRDGQAWADY